MQAATSFIANIRVITLLSLTWIDHVINNSYKNIFLCIYMLFICVILLFFLKGQLVTLIHNNSV